MTANVLAVGHLNWDEVLHTEYVPDPDYSSDVHHSHTSSGGSATNTGLVLSNLGVDVAIAGSIAEDERGEQVEGVLRENNVTPEVVYTQDNTTVIRAVITDDADPRYFAENVELGEMSPSDLSEEVKTETNHLHVTSFDKGMAEEFAQFADESGWTISFNPSQNYEDTVFDGVVELADLIFLNKKEYEIFRQRYQFGEIVESGTTVVVTHGGAGCTLYDKGGIKTHSGYIVDEVEDTVGAGDSFIAGFLSEWLGSDGYEFEQALDTANACGASAVSKVGAPDEVDPEEIWSSQ